MIERVQVWTICPCGSEVVFDDVEFGGATYESQPCDDCGRVVEVVVQAEAQVK